MDIIKNYLLICLCFIYTVFALSGCSEEPGIVTDSGGFETDRKTGIGIMEVSVFDTGKADAILIQTETNTVMIDTGENKHGQNIAEYIQSLGITTIDYLIITHFHKDHVGGAHIILNSFEVREIIVPDYGKESQHYDRFAAAAERTGTVPLILTEPLRFTADNTEFAVFPPQSGYHFYAAPSDGGRADDEYDEDLIEDENENEDEESENVTNENNFSIIVSAVHGENNFLFTGDAKARRLREAMRTPEIFLTDYDYLKVPHHGRYNKRSVEFIHTVRPRYAVITTSSEIGITADKRVVSALEEAGAEIFLTTDGGVYCLSDGERLSVEHRDFFSAD
ncbi:MAG: MBL fold metallo-hydrolase [Oscillospiraceae bacterium]|nr:MBL fold metallo-hydrolase [Oscillospiraceae bacterium]